MYLFVEPHSNPTGSVEALGVGWGVLGCVLGPAVRPREAAEGPVPPSGRTGSVRMRVCVGECQCVGMTCASST